MRLSARAAKLLRKKLLREEKLRSKVRVRMRPGPVIVPHPRHRESRFHEPCQRTAIGVVGAVAGAGEGVAIGSSQVPEPLLRLQSKGSLNRLRRKRHRREVAPPPPLQKRANPPVARRP